MLRQLSYHATPCVFAIGKKPVSAPVTASREPYPGRWMSHTTAIEARSYVLARHSDQQPKHRADRQTTAKQPLAPPSSPPQNFSIVHSIPYALLPPSAIRRTCHSLDFSIIHYPPSTSKPRFSTFSFTDDGILLRAFHYFPNSTADQSANFLLDTGASQRIH